MISLAYLDEVCEIEKYSNEAESLDLISSGVGDININNFAKLKRIRAARCESMKTFMISNMQNLEVCDLSVSSNLKSAIFRNCPKLRALDLSFCTSLAELNGEFPKLEYLSLPQTQMTVLPKMPSLKFIDFSYSELNNISPKIFSQIEVFVTDTTTGRQYKLSEITAAKSLRVFEASHIEFIVDKKAWFSKLQFLCLPKCQIQGDLKSISNVYIVDDQYNQINEIPTSTAPFKYTEAQKLLYGPWGIPPTDRVDRPLSTKFCEFIPNKEINDKINMNDFRNEAVEGITGCIFGMAVNDMIGLGVEFMPKTMATVYLAQPLSIVWNHPRVSQHTASFVYGTSTDDTSQAVLIMRSIVTDPNISLIDFAAKLFDWMKNGHSEHKHGGGLGMGRTVSSVLNHECFLTDPKSAAKEVWEGSNRSIASNGAVMRTSPCGCYQFWDENVVIRAAKEFSKSTHADPRCVFSTVAISLLISRTLQVRTRIIASFDINETIQKAINEVEGIDKYKEEIMVYSTVKDIKDIKLGNGEAIGYTLKTYAGGVWALRYCKSFSEALEAVVKEGGDADTNGAVVGALMGAKYGYSQIPKELIDFMFDGQWLMREIKSFLSIMNL